MKIMKRYLSIIPSFALAAMLFTGCDNGLDEYPSDAPIPAPSEKFTTDIQFVSRLNDAALGAGDYTAFDGYVANTLGGKSGSWLTILDRADNGNVSALMQTALNTRQYTAFAFNRIVNKTSWQGSMLYFNDCLPLGAQGVPTSKGCYVTDIKTRMTGTRTDKNDAGEVTGEASVSFEVDFLTARFDTAEQIEASGGRRGVLRSFYDANMPMLMVGTVKNDLLGALQTAAGSIGSNYAVKVWPVAEGSQYTLFMLSEERFWGFHSVQKKALSGGLDAYAIKVMW